MRWYVESMELERLWFDTLYDALSMSKFLRSKGHTAVIMGGYIEQGKK